MPHSQIMHALFLKKWSLQKWGPASRFVGFVLLAGWAGTIVSKCGQECRFNCPFIVPFIRNVINLPFHCVAL